MNRSRKISAVLACAALGFGFWTVLFEKPASTPGNRTPAAPIVNFSAAQSIDPGNSSEPALPVPRHPSAASSETMNLEEMTKTLFQFTRPESRLKDLVDYLDRSHQDPLVVNQSNPATGEMAIVRTKSPLPGTRYFHAQYMIDENQKGFVQHMSFEFKPGPNAMSDAQAAIQSSFPNLGRPQTKKDDFVRWNLDENYFVWIKKMGPEDLKDDPFNAYTTEDIGTVRVAIEVEIHGDEDHHN